MSRHHQGHRDLPWESCNKPCEKKREKCIVKCEEPKCAPKCEVKCKPKCEEKKCHKKKRCSSSSSSSSDCGKLCVPRVVYSACVKGGNISLGLTVIPTTPNGVNNTTFTCPTQIGQKIYLQWTITNLGNVSIKGPIMLYSSTDGVHKVSCKKLAAGASVTKTTHFKITKCNCISGGTISLVANAYNYVCNNSNLILVSQPVGVIFTQTA